jgi:anaerobic selenocysteine-containing dehydrogenase
MAESGGGPGRDYVLARGGRFDDYTTAYDGTRLAVRFGGRIYFFAEVLSTKRDSVTGQYFDGMGKYEPIADMAGQSIAARDSALPLQLITYKMSWHSQMHTARYSWLMSVQAENFIEMNPQDAEARDLQTGDRARLTSASAPQGVEGLVQVTGTVAPGVVAVSHHFGHWEMSSRAHRVNGTNIAYDASRGAGINATPLMRADPVFPNVTLQDRVGGSASFYDTRVEVRKIA